jgi:thermopsin
MNPLRSIRWTALGLTAVMIVAAFGLVGSAASPLARASAGESAVSVAGPTHSVASTSREAVDAAPAPRIAAPSAPLDTSASNSSPGTTAGHVLRALAARGVPVHDIYLPDFAGEVRSAPADGHVNVTYTSSPAPYGIGDFGLRNVSGVVTPYVTSTTSLNATFATDEFLGYAPDISGPDEYGVQLNAVLNNVTLLGRTGYQFWTQNVFDVSPSNQTIQFVSNIWNFSGGAFDCNALYSFGGYCVQPEYYYGLSAPIPALAPYTVHLWLNSTLNQGRNEVFFNYSVDSALGPYYGSYDYAIFNSLATGGNPALTPAAEFVANGHTYSPIGLPDDFEITVGGPGGGSNFDVFATQATYMQLGYLNGTTGEWQNVDSAYNVGGETGETSYGVNDAWAAWSGSPGCADCAELNAGPSFQYGLWNVSAAPLEGVWATQPYFHINVNPMTAFVFVAPGSGVTNLSLFQWSPTNLLDATSGTRLPNGSYTFAVLAANYDPSFSTFTLTGACSGVGCNEAVTLTFDSTTGVYTPLWALNDTADPYISSGVDGYLDYVLFNNEYADIGSIPCLSNYGCASFPWFGTFNDYMFPVFPGIYLYESQFVDITNPPSFLTQFPPGPTFQRIATYFGTPDSNSLQMVFYFDDDLLLGGGTIAGWWPSESYFGPSQSAASVQFWNTSDSEVYANTFEVGGIGLFLYGGTDNEIFNNSFYTYAPPAANPGSITAAYYGSVGMVDTDWGYAFDYPGGDQSQCYSISDCDVVWNNIFDTWVTATQLYNDPYTGTFPLYPFSEAYNVPYTPGATNILGGDFLGGNYWWDYGYDQNPYNQLPYEGVNYLPEDEGLLPVPAYICESEFYLCDTGGGDWYPLTYLPLDTVNFTETGLPTGQEWVVGTFVGGELSGSAYDLEAGDVENDTVAGSWANLSFLPGEYTAYAYATNPAYAAPDETFNVTGGSIHVTFAFQSAYSITATESGLPGTVGWTLEAERGGTYYITSGGGTSHALDGLLPGTYTWFALADGWAPVPASGTVTLASDVTETVTFVAYYVISVHATGLTTGTDWTFTYASTSGGYGNAWQTTGAWINLTLPALTYDWAISAPGFTGAPATGSEVLTSNTTLSVTFDSVTATGTLSGTVTPSGASLWVDGAVLSLGPGGTFSVTLPVGVHSVEATASGYVPYYNNVTVTAGGLVHLTITLTATSSSSNGKGVGTLGWVLVALLAALAAIFLVTTIIYARRGRQPPPMTGYTPSGAAPPSGPTPPGGTGAPPWQEAPPPPPPGAA